MSGVGGELRPRRRPVMANQLSGDGVLRLRGAAGAGAAATFGEGEQTDGRRPPRHPRVRGVTVAAICGR